MKITDLMSGDLLTFRDCQHDSAPVIFEIKEIHESELVVQFNDEQGYDIINLDDEVVGIPLTKEILEQNGIKLLEVGDNGGATPARYKNRFEKWEIHTQWKDTYLWYDRQAKYWHLSNMGAARLHFVHELQHALRLCGISKGIEL